MRPREKMKDSLVSWHGRFASDITGSTQDRRLLTETNTIEHGLQKEVENVLCMIYRRSLKLLWWHQSTMNVVICNPGASKAVSHFVKSVSFMSSYTRQLF